MRVKQIRLIYQTDSSAENWLMQNLNFWGYYETVVAKNWIHVCTQKYPRILSSESNTESAIITSEIIY